DPFADESAARRVGERIPLLHVMSQFLHDFWPHITITSIVVLLIQTWAVGHAVLYKRDSRATIGWVGLIVLTPLVCALLYWIVGINRSHRKAKLMRAGEIAAEPAATAHAASHELIEQALGQSGQHFLRLVELVENATNLSLLAGNRIEPLIGGDEAYPAML